MLENIHEGSVLLVDKPHGWTSFDAVNKLRYGLKVKKIGHAGTLDPLATGLLILCTGKKTKEIEQYQAQEKEYTGTLVLGQTTPSHDLETEVDSQAEIGHLSEEEIRAAVQPFLGDIMQTPPMHSAVRVGGVRAYKHARKGRELKLDPRPVQIMAFELSALRLPEIDFRIVCSKGTYIRSLVRDFGKELGVGAYMSALRRTRIGEFRVEDAQAPQSIIDAYWSVQNENL
jgi:tRNA pseudouridine55 synthase